MKTLFEQKGHWTLDVFYSKEEVAAIVSAIENGQKNSENFRKSNDLFAIRQFVKEIPGAVSLIFTPKLKTFISEQFGPDYFLVKSIYFDKPGQSNWFVAWHQDLSISVKQKADIDGYGPWTVKNGQFGVQPPKAILENIFTLRIHLDDTDENNGVLKVIPGSHARGIQRISQTGFGETDEVLCPVKKGGIMFMKPLLFHCSGRSTGGRQRRVIHLEFSDEKLPEPLEWAEQLHIFS